METKDIIQSIGVVASIIFSLIAFIQSLLSNKRVKIAQHMAEEANKLANTANEISQKALDDSSKNYIPLIEFTNDIKVIQKDIHTLRNEITFDFDNVLFDGESDEITCISAEIQNVGGGIVTGIKIKEFLIQEGNEVSIDIRSQEELDTLCYIQECECERKFILKALQRTNINFIVTDNVMERENSDLKWAEERINIFLNQYNNFMISMSLEIQSINNSLYEENSLWGTYIGRKVSSNSFSDVKSKTN
jgi:hypothetical protein